MTAADILKERGIKTGMRQSKNEIVKNMLHEGFDMETIARVVKMPTEHIKMIRDNA